MIILRIFEKRITVLLIVTAIMLTAFGCSNQDAEETKDTSENRQTEEPDTLNQDEDLTDNENENVPEEVTENESEKEQENNMVLKINDEEVLVEWEDNESVEALKKICSEEALTIQLSMYGGNEQVGSIGQSLPRNDINITTDAGDIVLYSGNQIVLFYGSNSWAYTRLGHIMDKSASDMAKLLSNGDVSITIQIDTPATSK